MKNHTETITSSEYIYTVVFEPAEEGGYTVTCPALAGVVTESDTLEEARMMVKEAIACYIESLQEDNLPIPVGEEHRHTSIREEVTVQLKTV